MPAADDENWRPEWLGDCDGFLLLGVVSLLTGQKGSCKSTLASYVAAIVTGSAPFPDGTRMKAPGPVLVFCSNEDPETQWRRRIRLMTGKGCWRRRLRISLRNSIARKGAGIALFKRPAIGSFLPFGNGTKMEREMAGLRFRYSETMARESIQNGL